MVRKAVFFATGFDEVRLSLETRSIYVCVNALLLACASLCVRVFLCLCVCELACWRVCVSVCVCVYVPSLQITNRLQILSSDGSIFISEIR